MLGVPGLFPEHDQVYVLLRFKQQCGRFAIRRVINKQIISLAWLQAVHVICVEKKTIDKRNET
jgi:hypothetical protein